MKLLEIPDLAGLIATVVLTYVTIIALIRVSGKRSTSQMNNFDWVVTVSLGSISGSMILLEDVSWAEGAVAMATLLLLQFLVTKAVRRFPLIARIVKARPATLYEGGHWNEAAMANERVARSEVQAALRHNGWDDLAQVERVVLESDATLSVLAKTQSRRPD